MLSLMVKAKDTGFSAAARQGHPYETFELSWMTNFIRRGDTVFDIGANVGFFTLIFSKIVGAAGRVYSFEPEESNFALLSKNIKNNNLENTKAFQKAASNKTETTTLFRDPENSDKHQLWRASNTTEEAQIESVRIDDLLGDSNPSLVKIDVEGYEWAVLEGMEKILETRPVIVMEYWPEGIDASGGDRWKMISDLEMKGYHFYIMNRNEEILKRIRGPQLMGCLSQDVKNNLVYVLCIWKNTTVNWTTPGIKNEFSRPLTCSEVKTSGELFDADSRAFLQLFKADKSSLILEVGSNEENVANALVDNGYRVYGYDLRAVKGCDTPRYKRFQSDFVKDAPIHWYPETFDVIFATSSIEHFGLSGYDGNEKATIDKDYDSKAMGVIWNLLKPGGFAYITVPFGKVFKTNERQGWRQYDKESILSRIIGKFRVHHKFYLRAEKAEIQTVEHNGIEYVKEQDAMQYDGVWPHVSVILSLEKTPLLPAP